MRINNVINYVCAELKPLPNSEDMRSFMVAIAVLGIFGGAFSIFMYSGIWDFIGIVMIIVAVLGVIGASIIVSKKLTIYMCLVLKTMTHLEWFFHCSLIETMFLVKWQGFSSTVIWIYLPGIVVPLLMGWLMHKKLMKEVEYVVNDAPQIEFKWGAGVFSGHAGTTVVANMGQDETVIATLVGFGIVNCAMSLGLLNIQKLYYYKKYNLSEYIK